MTKYQQREALTERIMAWLPGPRSLWLMAWSAAPFALNMVLNSMAEQPSDVSILEVDPVGTLASVYVVALSLTAVHYLGRRVREMTDQMDDLVGAAEDARWGAGLGSTIGPVLLAVLLTALEDIGLVQAMDTAEQTILAPLQFIIHLSLAAGIWVVCCILASLHRVGLTNLRLDTTSGDPTLGLKPIGKIAVRTYALFAVGAAPILLANTDSAVALAINGGTFLIVTGFFVFALWGVHRQMATARDRVVGEARQRMRHIVGRIESRQDSDMTDQDATLVTAADILERRACEISGWPLTGGLYVRTGIILVGVLIGLITRAIGTALGV